MTSSLRLTLFFTRGVSLQTWATNGSLEREIALYIRLQQKKGVHVSFITYGNKEDLRYRDQLQGINILCNRWNLPKHWYEQLIPLLHARVLSRTNLIKTNQTNGADVALHAAKIWGKPLIARCGYMWSDFAQFKGNSGDEIRARGIEQNVFTRAKRVFVTTLYMKEYVVHEYKIIPDRIQVIPNYVLTDLFTPQSQEKQINQICFIGRLSEQKNLQVLIKACAGLDVELVFVGDGSLRESLQEQAKKYNVKLSLKGNLPHKELPDIICQSSLFVMVSHFEGHPKSLLEAMSCGSAVLGADTPGIREQIIHGETGWLVGTDETSIRAGIQHLLKNRSLREKLGTSARRFIMENYSLETIVEKEYMEFIDILNKELTSPKDKL